VRRGVRDGGVAVRVVGPTVTARRAPEQLEIPRLPRPDRAVLRRRWDAGERVKRTVAGERRGMLRKLYGKPRPGPVRSGSGPKANVHEPWKAP
jgi:hypothetical protein